MRQIDGLDLRKRKQKPKPTAPDAVYAPKEWRLTREYVAGQQAYRAGEPWQSCPYPSGGGRSPWLTGWLDARTSYRLADVFRRNGLTFP